MKHRAIAIFASILIGVPTVHANEKATLENLTCDIPDGWVLQKGPSNMVRYAAPKVVTVNGREQKLMLILGKGLTSAKNVEEFKKNLEPKTLGSPESLKCEIVVRNGLKFLKVSRLEAANPNPNTADESACALHFVDAKGHKYLLISGPKELFDANKDAIEKTLDSFQIKDAEQVLAPNGP